MLHENLNFIGHKRVEFFLELLCLREKNFFKKELFFWSLGLFLDLQGSHSNRLHV